MIGSCSVKVAVVSFAHGPLKYGNKKTLGGNESY